MSILFSGWFAAIAVSVLLVSWNYGKDFLQKKYLDVWVESDEDGIKELSEELESIGEFREQDWIRSRGLYRLIFRNFKGQKVILFCPYTFERLLFHWKLKNYLLVKYLVDAYITEKARKKPMEIELNWAPRWRVYFAFSFFFNWRIGLIIGPVILMAITGFIYPTEPINAFISLGIGFFICVLNSLLKAKGIINPKKQKEFLKAEKWLLPIESDITYVDVYTVEYDINKKVKKADGTDEIVKKHVEPKVIWGYEKVQDLKIDSRVENLTYLYTVEYDKYIEASDKQHVGPIQVTLEEYRALVDEHDITKRRIENVESIYTVEYDVFEKGNNKIIRKGHMGPIDVKAEEYATLDDNDLIRDLEILYTVEYDILEESDKDDDKTIRRHMGPITVAHLEFEKIKAHPRVRNFRRLVNIEYDFYKMRKIHAGPTKMRKQDVELLKKDPLITDLDYKIKTVKRVERDLLEMKNNRRSYLARNAALWDKIITLKEKLHEANRKIRGLHEQLSYQQASEHERLTDTMMTLYKQAEDKMLNLKQMFQRVHADAAIKRDWKGTLEDCLKDGQYILIRELIEIFKKLMKNIAEMGKDMAKERNLNANQFEKLMAMIDNQTMLEPEKEAKENAKSAA